MKLFFVAKNGIIAPRLILRVTATLLFVFNIMWAGWGIDISQMFRAPNYWRELIFFSVIGIVMAESIFQIQLKNMWIFYRNLTRFAIIQFSLGVLFPWSLLYAGGHYIPVWFDLEVDTSFYYDYRISYIFLLLLLFNKLLLCVLLITNHTGFNHLGRDAESH